MFPKNNIAITLKKYRQLKNLTITEFSSILRLSEEEYQFIENGNRPIPLKTMQRIFDNLEISELEFFVDESK